MKNGKKNWLDRAEERLDLIAAKLSQKEMRIPTELVAGGLFFALALAILLVMPQQVAVSEGDVINGRAFPTLLMVIMLVCCGVLVVRELYHVLIQKRPLVTKKINLLTEVKALIILGILCLTYLVCRWTNLFVVGACVCSLCFLLYFRCRKWSYYVITLSIAVLIWVAFRFGLNVSF